ncbi:hypothetical protein NHJ13734_000131 [Beauveria thailandica]
MPSPDITVRSKTRLKPQSTTESGRSRAILLSLLDATTSSFALIISIWVFDRPEYAHAHASGYCEIFVLDREGVDVFVRLRTEDMQQLLAEAQLFPSSDD